MGIFSKMPPLCCKIGKYVSNMWYNFSDKLLQRVVNAWCDGDRLTVDSLVAN